MTRYRKADPSAMLPQPKPGRMKGAGPLGRRVSPEQQRLIDRMKTIVDESVAYEVILDEGEKPLTVRQQIVRAAKAAGVEVAIRRSPRGFYVALMTPARRSRRTRGSSAAG